MDEMADISRKFSVAPMMDRFIWRRIYLYHNSLRVCNFGVSDQLLYSRQRLARQSSRAA